MKALGGTVQFKRFFRELTIWDWLLWTISLLLISAAFLLTPHSDALTLAASLVGVTALIFAAKGHVMGQVLIVLFSLIYAVISFRARYYGEMMTYIGMSMPIAIASIVTWLRNPFAESAQVAVARMRPRQIAVMFFAAVAATVGFFFLLRSLGTAQLFFSTLSVFTSFIAAWMSMQRSAFYALGYAANDVVLIVLWLLESKNDAGSTPMLVCFVVFLCNDLYAFFNWLRMRKQQEGADSRENTVS